MCVSCGCGEPNERHGDDRHITQDDLDQAAAAADISTADVVQNISTGARQAGAGAGGQE